MFLIPSSWSWVLRLLYTPAKGSKEIVCPGGFSQNHGAWLALRPSEKCWCRGAETHCHLKGRDGEGAGASSSQCGKRWLSPRSGPSFPLEKKTLGCEMSPSCRGVIAKEDVAVIPRLLALSHLFVRREGGGNGGNVSNPPPRSGRWEGGRKAGTGGDVPMDKQCLSVTSGTAVGVPPAQLLLEEALLHLVVPRGRLLAAQLRVGSLLLVLLGAQGAVTGYRRRCVGFIQH